MENRLLVTAPVMDLVVVVRRCKTGGSDIYFLNKIFFFQLQKQINDNLFKGNE